MGWDIDRFPEGEVNLELICCICTCILEDPVESPCRHVFCSKCIKTWLSNQKSCPHCRASVHKRDLQSVVPLLKNIISKQRIFCDNKENGCDETVPLETLQSHVASCQYGFTTCTNEGCNVRILRKDFKTHVEICSKRTVLCEDGCEMLLKLGERSTHNCVQSLRAHFQEVQNEMLTRISKLEELVNVLVSKTSTERTREGSRANSSSETYNCVPYNIPSPRSYESRPPPYSVYPDIHDSTINLTSYPLEQNDLSDSVESIESDHGHDNDYPIRAGRQSDSPVERPMSPVFDHLERRPYEQIYVNREERRRGGESRRDRQRSRSPHFRNRTLDTTYTRNNANNIRSDRENRHNRTYDRMRRDNNDDEIVLRLGVSQAVSDSSTSSSSSSESDTD